MAVTTLDGLDSGLVPTPIANAILAKAQEQSLVGRLATSTPIPLEGLTQVTQNGHIEAGVVGEGEAKPVGNTSYASKTIKPIKLAAIAVVSKELRMANPARILENIQADLAGAITRAIDLAVFHGRNAKTGGVISGVESLNQTTNRVELNALDSTDLAASLLAGYDLVVQGDQVYDDFNGFAFDKRFRSKLIAERKNSGDAFFQSSMNLRDPLDTVLGVPAAYGRGVSGRIGASTDTNVKGFGGDWGALQYGFAEQMTISRSDQASIVDGATTHNLFQENKEAYLVEAIFGWAISDVNAFAAYEDAVADV